MLQFIKYHGCGNDFVFIDAADNPGLAARGDWPALAAAACDRHLGIGADQMLLAVASPTCDVGLRIFNADGGEAEMCGNGVRCLAKHMIDRRGFDGDRLRVALTLSGRVLEMVCERRGDRFYKAHVDMGEPVFAPAKIPVKVAGDRAFNIPLPADLPDAARGPLAAADAHAMTCVSMGNPHAVIFVSGPVDPGAAGPWIEHAEMFPRRINVQFVKVLAPDRLRVWTWERGAGVTLGCGTGACASAVAAAATGRAGREVTVELTGGTLKVRWDERTGRVMMSGGATEVFEGTWSGPA
ncbi:MAG: diaminopimelate epimerase [Planctomycetes bacterium]|nr:diaminopimelate epimerase [Planctomycetota bacterium]